MTVGPIDSSRTPRFAGLATFARLPRRDEVPRSDVAIVGVPFDSGVSYRPGARFGPAAIREASRLLRPYHPGQALAVFEQRQFADYGDISCTPFEIEQAIGQIAAAADEIRADGATILALGGDHTIALPLLRSAAATYGPVALVHFDAHLDTWDTYFDAPHTHGTVFRRAAEEGLLDTAALTHVGIRGPLYSAADLTDDALLGFSIVRADDLQGADVQEVAQGIRKRIGDRPVYISVDIDVLDPAHAPGTGTPEAGGLTSRELLLLLRGLAGARVVGADVVEVAPAYDHAELTALAASHVAYELAALLAIAPGT